MQCLTFLYHLCLQEMRKPIVGPVSDPCENVIRIQELQDQVTSIHAFKLSATTNNSPIPLSLTWGQFLKNGSILWKAWGRCFIFYFFVFFYFLYKDSLLFLLGFSAELRHLTNAVNWWMCCESTIDMLLGREEYYMARHVKLVLPHWLLFGPFTL